MRLGQSRALVRTNWLRSRSRLTFPSSLAREFLSAAHIYGHFKISMIYDTGLRFLWFRGGIRPQTRIKWLHFWALIAHQLELERRSRSNQISARSVATLEYKNSRLLFFERNINISLQLKSRSRSKRNETWICSFPNYEKDKKKSNEWWKFLLFSHDKETLIIKETAWSTKNLTFTQKNLLLITMKVTQIVCFRKMPFHTF